MGSPGNNIDGWKYDVFLSFRGEDTRKGFTGHLYSSLSQKGIKTFIDDEELERGEEISPALVKAIRESIFSVVVFSKNYASSTWCLSELVEILRCMESQGQKVLPIFYDVEPSEVRHQRGIYGKALAEHEERFKRKVDDQKVQEWRTALTKTSNFSGWDIRDGHESKNIQSIVEEIFKKLNHMTHLSVAKLPVGLSGGLEEVNPLMAIEDRKGVRMIGVYGHPGIGKTTIAKAIYNTYADKFEGSSFLKSIGEVCKEEFDLVRLQELLLCDVLGVKNLNCLGNVDRGINLIKKRLGCKRVLVVLDGVDHLDRLDKLAGGLDWFGSGSRVIITTRHRQLVKTHQVSSTYRVQKMTRPEAVELFSWHAFEKKQPDANYMRFVNDVVFFSRCIPSTLVRVGTIVYSKTKSTGFWKTMLEEYDWDTDSLELMIEIRAGSDMDSMLDTKEELIVSTILEYVSDSVESMLDAKEKLVSTTREYVAVSAESMLDAKEKLVSTAREYVAVSAESMFDAKEKIVSTAREYVAVSAESMLDAKEKIVTTAREYVAVSAESMLDAKEKIVSTTSEYVAVSAESMSEAKEKLVSTTSEYVAVSAESMSDAKEKLVSTTSEYVAVSAESMSDVKEKLVSTTSDYVAVSVELVLEKKDEIVSKSLKSFNCFFGR